MGPEGAPADAAAATPCAPCAPAKPADAAPGGALAGARAAFAQLRPGHVRYDLSVPPQLLYPTSALQLYGALLEAEQWLEAAAEAPTPEQRMLGVMAFVLAAKRPPPFFKKPYNPVLGETHLVAGRSAWLLVEQVSHHPPVSAFHVCQPAAGASLAGSEQPRPFFNGLAVDVAREGPWALTLRRWDETYALNAPSLCMRLLPAPGAEWAGSVRLACAANNLTASLDFHPRVLPGTKQHGVSGAVSAGGAAVYTLRGRWSERVSVRDERSGAERVLLDAMPLPAQQLAGAPALSVVQARALPRTLEDVSLAAAPAAAAAAASIAAAVGAAEPTLASGAVWERLTAALHAYDWHAAREAKHAVEEAQRAARKAREAAGEAWMPRFFHQPGGPAGPWLLKHGVEEALTAALFGGDSAAVSQQPFTPEVPPRRSADAA